MGNFRSLPWVIVRDFKVVLKRSERSSGNASRYERMMFRGFIDTHGLMNLNKTKPNFNFSNEHILPTLSQIDRTMANPLWMEIF